VTKISLLLSHERSGSHLAGEFIGALENYRMVDEVCNPGALKPNTHKESFHRFKYDYILADPSYSLEPSRKGHSDFVNAFFEYLRSVKSPHDIAIDIKYGHVQNFEWWWWPPLERPYLLAFCEQNDIGIVHLYRENVIEATVSSAIADQRKIWHSWEAGADARVSQKYKLNIKALMHRAKLLEQQSQLFKRWTGSNRKLEITYEELAAGIGRGGAIESRIGEFLGSKPRRAFEPRHQKLTPPLRDVVENFEELKAACRAEGLGRYLA
jgi:hypothetical protein